MTVDKREYENGGLTIIATGRLDSTTAPEFEKFVQANIDAAKTLIFDFSDLEYISSAGLRVLLWSQKIMNTQGSMKVIGCNEAILRVFSIAGLLDVFTII